MRKEDIRLSDELIILMLTFIMRRIEPFNILILGTFCVPSLMVHRNKGQIAAGVGNGNAHMSTTL